MVIKKLGHNSDHELLDNYILSNAGSHWENQECNHVSVAVRPLTHQFLQTKFIHDELGESGKLVHHLKLFNKISDQDNALDGSDMLICPSQRKIDYIEEKVFERNQGVYRLTFLYNFMTTLLFNSEPLIFQVLLKNDVLLLCYNVALYFQSRLFLRMRDGPLLDIWVHVAAML